MKNNSDELIIMLVDDNDIDNLVNQKLIEKLGYNHTILVHTGAISALEFLKSLEVINKRDPGLKIYPDYILLDIDMPIMDGFQFLEEFAQLSTEVKTSTKIVMLTSSISPYDLSKANENNYVMHVLNKPLDKQDLDQFLNN